MIKSRNRENVQYGNNSIILLMRLFFNVLYRWWNEFFYSEEDVIVILEIKTYSTCINCHESLHRNRLTVIQPSPKLVIDDQDKALRKIRTRRELLR